MKNPAPLKLRARDAEDLQIIAGCLQDALVNLREMTFTASERRFILIANRFRWEAAAGSDAAHARPAGEDAESSDATFSGDDGPHANYERIHCGVCFEQVRGVKTKGLQGPFKPRFLELLTIRTEPGAILLVFAGKATVRLEVDVIRCYLEDLGEAWPTAWRPAHAIEEAAGGRV